MDTMIALNSIIILGAAFLVVFLEAAVNGVFRVQLDLLPALMVYASLTAGPVTVGALALCGGLWFDSLSANPLGISVLPLLLIGWLILQRRDLILHSQVFAQLVLGLGASFVAPALALAFMLSTGKAPLIGWGTVWQLAVMTVVGGGATPALFKLFGLVTHAFEYREAASPSFRPDREIRRGRN
jgi:cell shape-determining protein MreD